MLTIILILILLILVCHVVQTQNVESFDVGTSLTTVQKINLLKCMLVFHELSIKHDLWYNVGFGTLLGAVRHRGFIPWDDDIDLLVFQHQLDLLNNVLDVMSKQFGYKIEHTWKVIRIYADEKHFIDLFPISIVDEKVIRCQIDDKNKCQQVDQTWWTSWFGFPSAYLAIDNKKMYQFDGLNLYGTTRPIELLSFWYGEHFLTTCKTHYLSNHDTYVEPKIIKCQNLPEPQL